MRNPKLLRRPAVTDILADTTTEPQTRLTFEQVWTALMELRKASVESGEGFDRRFQETDKEIPL
jgi:hypothetical protein